MQPSTIRAGVSLIFAHVRAILAPYLVLDFVAIPSASPIGAHFEDASCNFSPPRSISLRALIMVLHQ